MRVPAVSSWIATCPGQGDAEAASSSCDAEAPGAAGRCAAASNGSARAFGDAVVAERGASVTMVASITGGSARVPIRLANPSLISVTSNGPSPCPSSAMVADLEGRVRWRQRELQRIVMGGTVSQQPLGSAAGATEIDDKP